MRSAFIYTQKKIYDAILGFIRFDEIEKELIDSIPFQRLHHTHQIGLAYLVYPGATHTRFEHSLGVMELSTRIYKLICKRVRPDLFDVIPRIGSLEYLYWKKILRIASLCHDIGQYPFSLSIEKKDRNLESQNLWTLRIIQSKHLEVVWKKISDSPLFDRELIDRNIQEDVIKISLGKKVLDEIWPNNNFVFTPWEELLSQIISDDFLGTDRMDNLLRDAKYTGVSYGLFDYFQLIESFRILPKENSFKLGIDESGLESTEALFFARHLMYQRVYLHPSILAFANHIYRALKAQNLFEKITKNLDSFLYYREAQLFTHLSEIALDPKQKGYEDAIRIIYRKEHDKVIIIQDLSNLELIKSFKEEHKLLDEQISFEIKEAEMEMKYLDFPVSRRYFLLESAKNMSELFSTFSFKPIGFVFIAKEFEQLFLEKIKAK